MSLTELIPVNDDSFRNSDLGFTPVVKIGHAVRYHIKNHTRPTKMYIEVTPDTLENLLSTEVNRQRLLKWLAAAVLPSMNREKK